MKLEAAAQFDDVLMVQPFTVTVLDDVLPGPPVLLELDTEPLPA
jgi:hypothetical protein